MTTADVSLRTDLQSVLERKQILIWVFFFSFKENKVNLSILGKVEGCGCGSSVAVKAAE